MTAILGRGQGGRPGRRRPGRPHVVPPAGSSRPAGDVPSRWISLAIYGERCNAIAEGRLLEVGDNRLTRLPAELGQLTNLRRLGLSNNCLTELPTQLGQLARLQALDLAGNDLKELPSHLGELTNLQELDLWRNQLTDLPAQLGQLRGLQRLDLVRNPLEAPLPDTVGRPTSQASTAAGSGSQVTQPPRYSLARRCCVRRDQDTNQTVQLGRELRRPRTSDVHRLVLAGPGRHRHTDRS